MKWISWLIPTLLMVACVMGENLANSYKTTGEQIKQEEVENNDDVAVETGNTGITTVDGQLVKVKIVRKHWAAGNNIFIPHGLGSTIVAEDRVFGLVVGTNSTGTFHAPSTGSERLTHGTVVDDPSGGFVHLTRDPSTTGSFLATGYAMIYYIE